MNRQCQTPDRDIVPTWHEAEYSRCIVQSLNAEEEFEDPKDQWSYKVCAHPTRSKLAAIECYDPERYFMGYL